MKKYFLVILTFLVIASCSVLEQTDQKTIGTVIYKTQESKKVVDNEEYSSTPIIEKKSVIICNDSITQIKYVTIKQLKKYKGEYYTSVENSLDTIQLTNNNCKYTQSEYLLAGNFLRPKSQLPFFNFTDHGVEFQIDGSCIFTWVSHCSDSPCSTTRQIKGQYQYVDDTISVTYFLSRFFDNNMIPDINNSVKTINDVQWRVAEPIVLSYKLSKDTLFALNNSRYSQIGTNWIISDTITLLPTKPKTN